MNDRNAYGFITGPEDYGLGAKAFAHAPKFLNETLNAPEPTSAMDNQIGGDHYKSMPIQPMEFSMANQLDACQHTVIKYVTRFRVKGGVEDLRKAQHVIDMLIEFEQKRCGKRT